MPKTSEALQSAGYPTGAAAQGAGEIQGRIIRRALDCSSLHAKLCVLLFSFWLDDDDAAAAAAAAADDNDDDGDDGGDEVDDDDDDIDVADDGDDDECGDVDDDGDDDEEDGDMIIGCSW